MNPHADELYQLLADAADSWLAQASAAQRRQPGARTVAPLSRPFWAELAAQGWLALALPEAQGGSGLGVRAAAVLAHHFGRYVVPEPLIACALLPGILRTALPSTAAGWATLDAGLCDGSHLTTLAWQEHPQSLDPHPRQMQAEAIDGGWRLHGRKTGVVAADAADSLLITAQAGDTPGLWRVAPDTPGLQRTVYPTSDGSTLACITLDDTRLPQAALLAHGPALIDALTLALTQATLLSAWQLVGVTEHALALTLEHLRTREQFGRPIGSFQAMQHLAVDLRVQLALAQAASEQALALAETAPLAATTQAAIAAAKARASDAALLAGRHGVQAHGATGYAAEAAIGHTLKVALRLSAWLGNSRQQRARHAALAPLPESLP